MLVTAPLVVRLERSAAQLGTELAAATAAICATGAAAMPWAGGALVALGAGRYVNRGVGCGLTYPVEAAELDVAQAFFSVRGLRPSFEVSPWCNAAFVGLLAQHGYGPDFFRNVYLRTAARPDAPTQPAPDVEVVSVEGDRLDEWLAVLAAGNELQAGPQREPSDEYGRAAHAMSASTDLLALVDGAPAAAGSIQIADRVAWLGGMAVRPEHRRRGLQRLLLGERIRLCADLGVDLVAATATPTGTSARNLDRAGFQTLYSQVVLTGAG